MRHLPFTLTLAALALLTVAGCGGSKDVVTVDGEAITMEEFNQYIATKRSVRIVASNGQVGDANVSETLGFQALQEMATQKIVMHMAADEGLQPSESEVEAEIKFKTALNPNYLTGLKGMGFTMGQIRNDVAYQLCEERLLTRGIDVKMDEVDRLIADNPDQFMEPATVDLYQILALTTDRKDQVDKALATGEQFKSVAQKFNQDAGGERLQLQSAALAEPLKSLITATAVGANTDWINVGNGVKKFYIEGRTEAKPMNMTKERREYLRRQLALSYGRQANDLTKKIVDRLRSSKVVVSDDEGVLKDMWDKFEDRLEKTMGTPPGSTGAATEAPADTETPDGG